MATEINSFSDRYRFLSNFYPSEVKIYDLVFPTVEHAYQAAKSLDRNDHIALTRIKDPWDAKRYGYTIILRIDWESIKVKTMLDLLRQKFQDPLLKRYLLATKDAILIEGNDWHDNYWGDCSCNKCRAQGTNVLGLLLMQVRDESNNLYL